MGHINKSNGHDRPEDKGGPNCFIDHWCNFVNLSSTAVKLWSNSVSGSKLLLI